MPPGLVRIFFEAARASSFRKSGWAAASRQLGARRRLLRVNIYRESPRPPAAARRRRMKSQQFPLSLSQLLQAQHAKSPLNLPPGDYLSALGDARVFSDVRSAAAWLSWLKWARADKTAAQLLPWTRRFSQWRAPFAFEFTFAQRKSLDLHLLQHASGEPPLKLHSDPQTA